MKLWIHIIAMYLAIFDNILTIEICHLFHIKYIPIVLYIIYRLITYNNVVLLFIFILYIYNNNKKYFNDMRNLIIKCTN